MSTIVTSHYESKKNSTNPSSIVHKFTFANSDISAKITEFDTIERDASDVLGGDFTIEVENASKTFNSLLTNKAQFFQEGIYDFGFSTDSGTNDTIQLFGGTLAKAKINESKAKLIFEDKLTRLKNKRIGDSETPVSFTNTEVNPADLTWWMVTSYGGLSIVKSSSNPDIDYDKWLDWFNVFEDNVTTVKAYFTGQDLIESLQVLRDLTDSVIYVEGNNKIVFNRWTATGSTQATITDSITTSPIQPVEIIGDAIQNSVKVLVDFDVDSGTWADAVTVQNTSSVNTYGVFEEVYQDESIWYANTVSAQGFGERVTFRRSTPNAAFSIETPLSLININVGDEVIFNNNFYDISSLAYSLVRYEKNLENKTVNITIDEGFNRGGGRLNGFILDDAVFGLLDQDYNPLVG